MPEQKIVKIVAEVLCPYCSEKVLVSFRSYSPTIDWALKEEDLKTSKEKLKNEVKKIVFDDPTKKKEVLSMIDEENLLISPEEVAPIVEQIIKDNVKPKNDTTKEN